MWVSKDDKEECVLLPDKAPGEESVVNIGGIPVSPKVVAWLVGILIVSFVECVTVFCMRWHIALAILLWLIMCAALFIVAKMNPLNFRFLRAYVPFVWVLFVSAMLVGFIAGVLAGIYLIALEVYRVPIGFY